MFVKINRINKSGDAKETIVNLAEVKGIFENPTRETHLYDEDGNVAETKPLPTTYNVEMGTFRFEVDADNYGILAKALLEAK